MVEETRGHCPEVVDLFVGCVGESASDRRCLSLVRKAHLRRSLHKCIRSAQTVNGGTQNWTLESDRMSLVASFFSAMDEQH